MNGLIKKEEKEDPSKADSRRTGIILVGEGGSHVFAFLRFCVFACLFFFFLDLGGRQHRHRVHYRYYHVTPFQILRGLVANFMGSCVCVIDILTRSYVDVSRERGASVAWGS